MGRLRIRIFLFVLLLALAVLALTQHLADRRTEVWVAEQTLQQAQERGRRMANTLRQRVESASAAEAWLDLLRVQGVDAATLQRVMQLGQFDGIGLDPVLANPAGAASTDPGAATTVANS